MRSMTMSAAPASAHRVRMARAFTREDLDAFPSDGYRRELIDGMLVVTPGPALGHQSILAELFAVVRAACPSDLRVLFAPFDVALAKDTILQPDLLVARRDAFSERDLPTAPLLAVEVLSRSTRAYDLTLKRATFEAAGTASYWVVDPGTGGAAPTMIGSELRGSTYVEVARATGDEEFAVELPFPVTIRPTQLLD